MDFSLSQNACHLRYLKVREFMKLARKHRFQFKQNTPSAEEGQFGRILHAGVARIGNPWML
jgi:hypothetical protein